MERHGRGKGKKRLLGSHQKCWLWGRNVVLETLSAGRWEILELYLVDTLEKGLLAEVQALARVRNVPVRIEPVEVLEKYCHTQEHQGLLARMAEYPYCGESELIGSLSGPSLVMILDGIQDPYNFGAILRSAEIFGAQAVFIPLAGQVGVTSMVARSSAGAVNRLPIARVESLEETIGSLQDRGIIVVAASEKAETALGEHDFNKPVAIIVGNEGRGVSPGLLERCDRTLRIPQMGSIGSLNAAVAAGIFLYEAARQRQVHSSGLRRGS